MKFNVSNFLVYSISILFAILALLSLAPYFIWNISPVFYRVIGLAALIFSLILFLKDKKIKIIAFFAFIVFFVSITVRHFSSFGIEPNLSFMPILLLSFLLLDNKIQKQTFDFFLLIYVILLIPSLILYVFIALGVSIDWTYLEAPYVGKSTMGLFYREYFGMVILSNQIFPFMSGELFRLSAIYDEPGVVGTVSALFLAATQFNIQNWKGKVLFISGILSFSFAFYVIIVIYLMFKNVKTLLKLIAITLFLIILLPDEIKDNRLVKNYVEEKINKTFSDIDSVDNRTDSIFDNAYKDFLPTTNIYLGLGKDATANLNTGSSSYKTIIYNHGIIGFISILLFYIVLLYNIKYKNQLFQLIPFFIVATASIYQRPTLETIWYLVIFIGAIFSTKKNTNTIKNILKDDNNDRHFGKVKEIST